MSIAIFINMLVLFTFLSLLITVSARLKRVEASIPGIVADRVAAHFRGSEQRIGGNVAYRLIRAAEGIKADSGIDEPQPYYG